MTTLVRTSEAIDAAWLQVDPVRVGLVPSGLGTPDCHVTVGEDDHPILRVDIYAHHPGSFYFQEALVWCGNLIVGFESYVHAVSIANRSAISVDLDSYFGHLYPERDYLLLASGECLFRMEPDRSIRWKSAPVGIDGVLVHDAGPPIIRGEGEWDPPGGWRPFAVLASDGSPA